MGEPVQSGAGQEAIVKDIWQLIEVAVTGHANHDTGIAGVKQDQA